MQFNLIVALLISCVVNTSYAKCNFVEADYQDELLNPKFIEEIVIETPKSEKYIKNFAKILVSPSPVIPKELKKFYKASVLVVFEFGECRYSGRIRQNGDWKDHIKLVHGGKPIRSLHVKLDSGNILNAVKFKLLIPQTRNNEHEVLGTILLRELGFMAPETFQVNTKVNSFSFPMLFQEDARKELLEKNSRREGPIFEGDESLLWLFEDFANFELEPLALSRLVNTNWFLKGANSQLITLKAYAQLQNAYVEYAQGDTKLVVKPNNVLEEIFEKYFFALAAMNGGHALTPHNRKFYFNSFINAFEPIYYDGNLNLIQAATLDEQLLSKAISSIGLINDFSKQLETLRNNQYALNAFKDRTLIEEKDAELFFFAATEQLQKNSSYLRSKIAEASVADNMVLDSSSHQAMFTEASSSFGIQQNIIFEINSNGESYSSKSSTGEERNLSAVQVAAIISENELDKNRFVYLPLPIDSSSNAENQIISHETFPGIIIHSVSLDIDAANQILTIDQAKHDDWILIKNADLKNWTVIFNGNKKESVISDGFSQRFNQYGLTGCLNIYRSSFNASTIKASDGQCEDILNIVNSKGTIDLIEIENAYADAIDLDFSQLSIRTITVTNAGNDCFDVSGGHYSVGSISASNCLDKGISIGERSIFDAKRINVENSFSGIAVKDQSKAVVHSARFNKVSTCYEVTQKKQEFGGAALTLGETICDAGQTVSANSRLIIGTN